MYDETHGSAIDGPTRIEADAEHLLRALDRYIVTDSGEAPAAERYGERLRFAVARVEELRRSALELGGAFEPARLEVSLSILESNVRQAGLFADRIVARMPKHVASRYRQLPAVEAIEESTQLTPEDRAA
ncbi:MAG: hypothetical protein M3P30_12045 [Chloroflexota bacterium]|nr:hypothetical protein [Chloroflexota bacterium]